MKVKYKGRSREVRVGPDRVPVARGETFDVDADLGKRLCEQADEFEQVKSTKKGDS